MVWFYLEKGRLCPAGLLTWPASEAAYVCVVDKSTSLRTPNVPQRLGLFLDLDWALGAECSLQPTDPNLVGRVWRQGSQS